jgi:hypothetical protein
MLTLAMDEAEFSKLMSGADPFKTLTYRIINLPFEDKYRLLRGVLDGAIVVGRSTFDPHFPFDPEDEMMKILEGIEMTISNFSKSVGRPERVRNKSKSLCYAQGP